ncbi:hypothetical protein RHGRI_021075 [Rhododendron griersonianum]|uniref:Uncharacterized protein n=1 Tax=Rhododendron griersonianum TaxID=479676 RepID=A0AAV6JMR1_9ERIC|nr:hypothetical protein RHGRI_021075 [Rhododendron griersonianum]
MSAFITYCKCREEEILVEVNLQGLLVSQHQMEISLLVLHQMDLSQAHSWFECVRGVANGGSGRGATNGGSERGVDVNGGSGRGGANGGIGRGGVLQMVEVGEVVQMVEMGGVVLQLVQVGEVVLEMVELLEMLHGRMQLWMDKQGRTRNQAFLTF